MRRYAIIQVSDIDKIDFDEIDETSKDTLRISVDGYLTFVKWNEGYPKCLSHMRIIWGPYEEDEFRILLLTENWTGSMVV